MKSKTILLIVLILLVIITGIVIFASRNNKGRNSDDNSIVQNTVIIINNTSENNIKNENEESEEIMNNTIKITINNKNYTATLEKNETAKQFASMLPQEFNMSELNGNEKYVYLDLSLPTDTKVPNKIEVGDIMLYGNNCLVVFYKSFNTSYSYTKIGHIENLEDLGNNNIIIEFKK